MFSGGGGGGTGSSFSLAGISDVLGTVCFLTLAGNPWLCGLAASSNSAGTYSGGIGSSPTAAPSTETVLAFNPTYASVSDWMTWSPGTGAQECFGIIRFGADGAVAPLGAIRFGTPINNRTILMASQGTGGEFQSIINISSATAGATQSLEIGREFWEQTLLYGSTNVIFVTEPTAGLGGYFWEVEGTGHQLRLVPNVTSDVHYWLWGDQVATAITQCTARSGKGTILLFQAGESSNAVGGDIVMRSGYNGSASTMGGFRAEFYAAGAGSYPAFIEMVMPAAGRRVVALCSQVNGGITTTQMPANTGDGVIYIGNAATVPTADSVSGGILYSEGGALKWRGTSGTITTLAAA